MTRTVLTAVDGSPASRPVLETGMALAEITGARARAIHVRTTGSPGTVLLARRFDIPIDVVQGPVTDRLLAALADERVVLGVIGARATPGGARPVGGTAMALLEHSATPLVVVPPDAELGRRPIRRIVVALEGSSASSDAIVARLVPLLTQPVELVAVHVVDPRSALVLDHARWDLDLWRDEFRARHCPVATRTRMASGPVAEGVRLAARREDADLVALTWGQDVAPDHAAIVRDLLTHSRRPVLLVPEDRS